MHCPTRGKEYDTGFEATKKQGLNGLDLKMALCPHCDQYHYLRLPYFEGDPPANAFGPTDGLETAPAFALEVGIIIAATIFMEAYIPQVFSKVSGMSTTHAVMTFGALRGTSQKIFQLDVLRSLQPKPSDARRDLSVLIKKFRKCSEIRDYYAHAKFNYGGGDSISIIPFFGDTHKKSEGTSVSLAKIREDAEFLRRTKFMIRDYIIKDVRPKG